MCVHLLTETPFVIFHRLLCITFVAWVLEYLTLEKSRHSKNDSKKQLVKVHGFLSPVCHTTGGWLYLIFTAYLILLV